jgi:hypothetical protein
MRGTRLLDGSCRRALRLLTALSLTGALVVPADQQAEAGVNAAASPGPATTRLTLRVHGCEGCTIQPVQATDGSKPAWRGKAKTVQDGLVHWKTAQRRTTGMSFDMFDPNAVALDFMTDIVVAYPGLDVGERVPASFAKHQKRANACWAGSQRASVTLRVRVERFPSMSEFPPQVSGYQIRPYLAWTKPFVRHFDGKGGTYTLADKGVTGNQDAYYCLGSTVR